MLPLLTLQRSDCDACIAASSPITTWSTLYSSVFPADKYKLSIVPAESGNVYRVVVPTKPKKHKVSKKRGGGTAPASRNETRASKRKGATASSPPSPPALKGEIVLVIGCQSAASGDTTLSQTTTIKAQPFETKALQTYILSNKGKKDKVWAAPTNSDTIRFWLWQASKEVKRRKRKGIQLERDARSGRRPVLVVWR